MSDDSNPPSIPPTADAVQTLASIAPVARQSVVDAVSDRLRGEILSGRLRPGTRLPSERELSLALGVNRLTLRAGLEMLGTLVRGLKLADPTWHDLVRSVMEVRRILAAEAVALAAARHTEE